MLSAWWIEKPLNSSRSLGASLPEMLGNKNVLFSCQDGFLASDEGRKGFFVGLFLIGKLRLRRNWERLAGKDV